MSETTFEMTIRVTAMIRKEEVQQEVDDIIETIDEDCLIASVELVEPPIIQEE